MKRTRKFSPEYLAYLESPAWNLKRALALHSISHLWQQTYVFI